MFLSKNRPKTYFIHNFFVLTPISVILEYRFISTLRFISCLCFYCLVYYFLFSFSFACMCDVLRRAF
jgi:hypothetical protein